MRGCSFVGQERPFSWVDAGSEPDHGSGIAYFAGCLGVFLRGLRRRRTLDGVTLACLTGAFGYLVSAFFGLTLYCTAPFLFIMLGLGYAQTAPLAAGKPTTG